MITLRDAIKRLQDRYALKRPDDPKAIIRSFKYVFFNKFDGSKFDDLLVDIKVKKNRLVLYVTHPVVIQEIEGFKEALLDSINRDMGEKLVLNIEFKVVPS